MIKRFAAAIAFVSCCAILNAQTTIQQRPTSSFEFNIGSMRPLGIYADNHPKEGMLDVGFEFQTNLKHLFTGNTDYFPLSIGMKLGYNYFTLLKESSGDLIYDTTGTLNFWRYEFKYTFRGHALNFHPFLELSTPQDRRVMAFAKGYFGPTTTWATSKFRNISKDSSGTVTKDKSRSYSINRWTLDYGYKIGLGLRLGSTFVTVSYTQIWGGEIEYLGKGSIISYDPKDPSAVEIEPRKSTTDRQIFQLGLKWAF